MNTQRTTIMGKTERLPQWPCRPPDELRAMLELVQAKTCHSKTGVVNYLLTLGVMKWQETEDERKAIRDAGLSPGALLPFLGYEGSTDDPVRVQAAVDHLATYAAPGVRGKPRPERQRVRA